MVEFVLCPYSVHVREVMLGAMLGSLHLDITQSLSARGRTLDIVQSARRGAALQISCRLPAEGSTGHSERLWSFWPHRMRVGH